MMAETFTQDFKRDDGSPVTVEYTYRPGSETTYSPMYGAAGGDPCDVCIIRSWPNTEEFNDLCKRRNHLEWHVEPKWWQVHLWIARWFLQFRVGLHESFATLTDVERERMEEWIIEHHVYEPSEEDYF